MQKKNAKEIIFENFQKYLKKIFENE